LEPILSTDDRTKQFIRTLADCLRQDGFGADTITREAVEPYTDGNWSEDTYRVVLEQVRTIMRAEPKVFDHGMLTSLVDALREEGVTADTLTCADVNAYTPGGTSEDEERALTEQVRALMREAEAVRP
jgi:hypothetical protein